MNISNSSFANNMMPQVQQRREPPSSAQLSSDIMKTSDLNEDSSLSSDEINLSEELFTNMDQDGDGTLNSSEVENGLSSMLDDMKNQNTSPEEFGTMLSNFGLDVPPPPPNSQDGMETTENSDSVMGSDDTQAAPPPPPPPPPPPSGEQGADDSSSSSDETYEAADTNEDGTVSAEELAAYTATQNKDMTEYTMKLVSTLLDGLKDEQEKNGTDDDLDLSQYKQVMSMVNEQTQEPKTSEMLSKYISQI